MSLKHVKGERREVRRDAAIARARLTRRAWIGAAVGGVGLLVVGQWAWPFKTRRRRWVR